jgi:hypothetical protein
MTMLWAILAKTCGREPLRHSAQWENHSLFLRFSWHRIARWDHHGACDEWGLAPGIRA